MADTVKQIGIKQQDGTYSMKDIEVDYSNVAGLSTQATSAKATADKNNKDITTYIAAGSHSGSNLVLTDGAGTSSNVGLGMTGATSNANGEAGFVPQPTSADVDKFLKADGSWATPPGKQYSGSSNISIDSSTNAIDLTNTSVSSGTYGPSADVTGTNGTTISVPNISVDAKGRITNITNKTYTSVDTGSKVFTGSLSEWNQLSTAEKKTYDFISNDEPGGTGDEFPANRVSYDNSVSGLSSDDVQDVIDELVNEKVDKGDIAPEFNITTNYKRGDIVYQNGVLYEFIKLHNAGPWNNTDVLVKHLSNDYGIYINLITSNISNGTGTVRFGKIGFLANLVIDITPSDASSIIKFDLPINMRPFFPIYSQYTDKGNNITIVFSSSTAQIAIQHTKNTEILITLSYIALNNLKI